jgi:hypothetical protein
MSNKSQLQTNNTALDALITRVTAAKEVAASLPESGGGGSIETYTGYLTAMLVWPEFPEGLSVVYTDPDLNYQAVNLVGLNSLEITTVKNSLFYVINDDVMANGGIHFTELTHCEVVFDYTSQNTSITIYKSTANDFTLLA